MVADGDAPRVAQRQDAGGLQEKWRPRHRKILHCEFVWLDPPHIHMNIYIEKIK